MTKQNVVNCIFDFAERNLDYLILRNYENLPEDEGHDIDLLINDVELPKIDSLIKKLKDEYHVSAYLRDDFWGLHSFALVFDGTILHLDFFTRIQWNRFEFINTSEALLRKERFKNSYWVLNHKDYQYYCWFNYVRSLGKVKQKYKDKAILWETESNHDIRINILNKNAQKNRFVLLYTLIIKNGVVKTICNTLKNVVFKVVKFFKMDGRIYITKEIDNPIIVTARTFCSCKQKNIESIEDVSLISLLRGLYKDTSYGCSPVVWNQIWWRFIIPRKYILNDLSSLESIVNNIYCGRKV